MKDSTSAACGCARNERKDANQKAPGARGADSGTALAPERRGIRKAFSSAVSPIKTPAAPNPSVQLV